jgi:uncharacterized membrane protein
MRFLRAAFPLARRILRPVPGRLMRSARCFLSTAQFRRCKQEDLMTTIDIALLINAFAAVVSALAQLVAALRRPP